MKKEHKIAIFIAFSVLLLINLPLFYFYLFHDQSLIFLGRRVINSQDLYTYISFIEQSKQGKMLFENLFTSEPQYFSLLRPTFILIGKAALLLNMSSILAYHLFRIIFTLIFFFVIYKFLNLFFKEPQKKLTAFFLILTSSGLGFLLKKYIPQTSDLMIPESNTFLSLSQAPDFILSQTLILLGFLFFIDYIKSNKNKFIFYSTLVFFILGLLHPYDLIVVMLTVFFTCILTKRSIVNTLFITFLSSFTLIYQIYSVITDSTLKIWYSQNVLLSPAPINYVSGFGILLILAIIGIEYILKKPNLVGKFILIWIFSTVISIYSPLLFQRRTIEGFHIPVSIAAAYGIFSVSLYLKKKWSKIILATLLFILSLTSIYFIYTDFLVIGSESAYNHYYFIPKTEVNAIYWLRNRTNSNDIILSNWFYGNLIPGFIARKVFLGHHIQTNMFENKVTETNTFLIDNNVKTAENFLRQNKISYIFLGINDPMLQYGFRPDQKKFLKKIYDKNNVLIYKVVLSF